MAASRFEEVVVPLSPPISVGRVGLVVSPAALIYPLTNHIQTRSGIYRKNVRATPIDPCVY